MTEKKTEKGPKTSANIEAVVSTSELAVLLGLSRRRIQQLTKIGVFKSISVGKYPLFESFRRYSMYLRRLLNRYMGLYRTEVKRVGRRTNFQKLPFYQDLQSKLEPFPQRELKKILVKDRQLQKLFKRESKK